MCPDEDCPATNQDRRSSSHHTVRTRSETPAGSVCRQVKNEYKSDRWTESEMGRETDGAHRV